MVKLFIRDSPFSSLNVQFTRVMNLLKGPYPSSANCPVDLTIYFFANNDVLETKSISNTLKYLYFNVVKVSIQIEQNHVIELISMMKIVTRIIACSYRKCQETSLYLQNKQWDVLFCLSSIVS